MRGRRVVLRSFAPLVLAATAACSYAVGFDGFVGDADPGADPNGANGGGAGSARDGGVPLAPREPDAGGPDGSSTGADAEVDATEPDPNVPPVFVDAGSFCGSADAATFCEDFDTDSLSRRWIQEGVFAKLTSYSARSAPNVFLVDAPPSVIGGTFVSKITRDFEAPSTDLAVEFDFKPERVNLGSSFLILAALEWTRGEAKYSLRLVYSSGSVRLEESNVVPPPNNKDAYHPLFMIPNDRWSRLKLDVVASGTTPGVQLSIDGVAVGVREKIVPTPGLDRRPTLILGAVFAGNPHTGWTLRYDNVALTFR